MEDDELQRAIAASLASAAAEEVSTTGDSTAAMTAQEQDQLTVVQLNNILSSIADSQPMVGDVLSLSEALGAEYAENPQLGFAKGIECLERRYAGIRRVRKDGNCFYRAFLYRYLEQLCVAQREFALAAPAGEKGCAPALLPELVRIREVVHGSKAKLLSVEYDESAIEMFWEMLLETLDDVPKQTPEQLHAKMNEEHGISMHIVWFCRALSACQIKLNPDFFSPFIMDENGITDVNRFCQTEVEPVNHECEQVQIIALTEMLGVPVAIEYLDASGSPSCIVFPEGASPAVKLLYRPGHYDVLYTQQVA